MEWDGLDKGGIPGPYDPKYRKFQRWKVLLKELPEGESFPNDSTPGDYIFSHRSLRNCPDKCAIGITLWIPDTASVMADIVPFPIHVGHALHMPAPPSPQIFRAGYAYVRHVVLRPGFNTIAWSAHSTIMYGQGIVRKVEPTLAFPGNRGYYFSTLSLNKEGRYSSSPALTPVPYDVQGGPVPLHISAYIPQGNTPPLRFLSALALGTCSDLTTLKDRNKIGSFIVAKTSLCSKKTGLDIAMNFKYCRLPSKEKERGYTVVII